MYRDQVVAVGAIALLVLAALLPAELAQTKSILTMLAGIALGYIMAKSEKKRPDPSMLVGFTRHFKTTRVGVYGIMFAILGFAVFTFLSSIPIGFLCFGVSLFLLFVSLSP